MQFHNWPTMVDELRATIKINGPKEHSKLTEEQLFDEDLRGILNHEFSNEFIKTTRVARLASERKWCKEGRPYYNVHPNIVKSLCKTNLDKIPSSLIEMPNLFNIVLFKFSDDIPTKFTDQNLIYKEKTEDFGGSLVGCRSVLFSKSDLQHISNEELKRTTLAKEDVIFTLFMDLGYRTLCDGVERSLCNTIFIACKDEDTIPQAIERTLKFNDKSRNNLILNSLKEEVTNLFKVIICSGFLANNIEENLVVPDVLSKDRFDFNEALRKNDKEKIDVIANRARRRGKIGYNIGTNEMFVSDKSPKGSHSETGTGKELTYSHIRSGHPHAVRYGENKSKVKIKWFRPTRIRDDLPFEDELK